jgi:hypothetical protein
MLLIGYFEGIQSQRGIAWRCADSLSLRKFLGIPLTEGTPDHSSLTHIRERLPQEVHEKVFEWVARSIQGMARAISAVLLAIQLLRSFTKTFCDRIRDNLPTEIDFWTQRGRVPQNEVQCSKTRVCSTGC